MKKNNKKKKLPRYWLGTRKPTSLGYLPNYGIGNAQFTSVQGEDLTPEVKATKANIIPGALNKLQQHASPVMTMMQNLKPAFPAAAATASTAKNLANVLGSSSMPSMQLAGVAAEKIGENAAKQAATKTLGAAGTVAGVLGAAYGAYDIANQFAHQNDHRSIGEMRNTLATNTYTTAGGNQYTEYSGINADAERAYEKALRTAKQLNLGVSLAGTGASIGGLIGSSVPLLGTAIGAGAGALLGGVASLLGFGDNEDEIEEQMRDLADTTSRQNRQSKSAAENQDVRDLFYSKSASAAKGKRPVWTPAGLVSKKATARVSNGEVIGNFEDGYVSRVPGQKNNKDTKLANLKDSDFVISNKFGLSDYAAQTGDYVGALNMLDILMNQYKNNYKCGKLPKCADGFWGNLGEYAFATLPHLGSYFTNLGLYNRAKNASIYVPQMEINNPQTSAAINQVMSDMIDPREYLNQSNSTYRQALWNIQRNPGLGLGGRMVAADSLNRAKFAQDAQTRMKIDEANRAQRNVGAQMREKLGHELTAKRYDQFWRRWGAAQQANAAKENWMAQYAKNRDMALINTAADALRVGQFHKSQDYQNRLLDLYNQQLNLDALKAGIDLSTGKPIVKTETITTPASTTTATPIGSQYTPLTSNGYAVRRNNIADNYTPDLYSVTNPYIGSKYVSAWNMPRSSYNGVDYLSDAIVPIASAPRRNYTSQAIEGSNYGLRGRLPMMNINDIIKNWWQ